MERNDFVLAVMSSCPKAKYDPVQIQKLFFLIDDIIPKLVKGPHFKFTPYNYGPFDKQVYIDLEKLASMGDIAIQGADTHRTYTTTGQGQEKGEAILSTLPAGVRPYIKKLSEFVRRLSFAELVSTIYKAYPKMKSNSIFQE